MEPLNVQHSVHVDGLLAKLRADHALTSDCLAALLGTSAGTLAQWESGRVPVSRAVEFEILRLARRLSFAGLESWKFRIGAASGPELLMDRSLTILTVSPAMLSQRAFEDGSPLILPSRSMVGRHVNDILPNLDCNLILNRGAGLSELHDIGFFQSRVRCVRICVELNFGPFTRHGVGEIWPVDTVDAGIAAHLLLHADRRAKNTLRAPGVIVHWSQIVPAEPGEPHGASA